jgi:hypothetical protein
MDRLGRWMAGKETFFVGEHHSAFIARKELKETMRFFGLVLGLNE